jgi:hypothetical protein
MSEDLKELIEYTLKNLDGIINDADWVRLKLFRGELRTLLALIEKWPGFYRDILKIFNEKERNDAE